MAEKKYWFKAKHYGWGWYPATWQGWLLTLAAIAGILAVSLNVENRLTSTRDVLLYATFPILAIAATLIVVAYLTGEKPRWRWGKDD